MAYVLLPWAQRAGLRTNKAKTRFAEQAWLLIYDSCSSGLGLVSAFLVGCGARGKSWRQAEDGNEEEEQA